MASIGSRLSNLQRLVVKSADAQGASSRHSKKSLLLQLTAANKHSSYQSTTTTTTSSLGRMKWPWRIGGSARLDWLLGPRVGGRCVTTLSFPSTIDRFPFKKSSNKFGPERPIHLSLERPLKSPFALRSQLKNAKRVVIKLGSAVITREDECGLALGRLASIVEQVAELQNEGRECLMVTSGAVAFGKQKLAHEQTLSMSMRETLHQRDQYWQQPNGGNNSKNVVIEPRAAAAVGQSGLMSLYDAMFSQYGVKIAQVLVTKPDFYNEETRRHLASTVSELISLNIVPIINTNDAVSPPPMVDEDLAGVISIKDNDSLAARLACEVNADLLILMSDVDGIYTCPPSEEGARLINTYCPEHAVTIQYGKKSRVGLGGMDSKVRSACWALEKGVSVVICNGMADSAIRHIIAGRKLGTFFTATRNGTVSVESAAEQAREGGRKLQSLTGDQRSSIIRTLADLLVERERDILLANQADVKALPEATGISTSIKGRLTLTSAKLKSVSDGLRQIADSSSSIVGRVTRRTLLADGLELTKMTVPIGVLLVIFESRPDVLPQVAALAVASANGLLLKGGHEAAHSNQMLMDLVRQALDTAGVPHAISLVSTREEISDLLTMDQYIDLVIPRGSADLVRSIQQQSKNIPVLGHSEGICHVYVDSEADPQCALKIVRDAKCDYPSACNAMETLLIHEKLLTNGTFFSDVCAMLKTEGVKIYAGAELSKHLTFGPPPAKSFRTEYGSLECTIQVVKSLDEAVEHINRFGSSHTDTIVTENRERADKFLKMVDSACVFHNASTRFADGYRFGLGAEVGISTARIHARGPVGVEGLLTSKWVLRGSCDAVADFGPQGGRSYSHQPLPVLPF